MLEIFRRSLRTGVVTTAYPAVPEPAPCAYRGQVMLDASRCTGSGDCVSACPSAAISVVYAADGGWSWELNDARCVFCGLCAEACPEEALQLSNEYELAVRRQVDLITHVTFDRDEREETS